MIVHNKSECFFNTTKQNFSVIYIDAKFSLHGIMDKYACSDADFIIFIFPVGFKCDWNSIPPISIDFSESFSASFDDSLRDQVRLLLQVRAKSKIFRFPCLKFVKNIAIFHKSEE